MPDPRPAALTRGTSVRDALDGATTAISAAGCETPRLDAELLLAHALGVSRERLIVERELSVEGRAVRVFQDYVRRRSVQREPVAYILGRRHFRNLELAVDHRALIPRPETELLVEVGLERPAAERVLDVGAGSGAVALALKHERPDLDVAGADISEPALALARENATRLGLPVAFVRSDLLDAIAEELDAILSNPPYVPDGDRASLAPEILRHEPADALFAGPDGLDVIRRLIAQAAGRPTVRMLGLEVGIGQAGTVGKLMRAAGFQTVRAERDLAGIERVVVGERCTP
jgi:release factor glutamine methyltransferase